MDIKGLSFSVAIENDNDMLAPWIEHDGHGSVRLISQYENKLPGERIIHDDGNAKWLYDFAGAVKTARADSWGIDAERLAKWTEEAGRAPTAGMIAESAVAADMAHCRAWLRGDWNWCGVVVTLLDLDGDEVKGRSESLWGISSEDEAYHTQVASELAAQIADEIGRKKFVTVGAKRIRVRA